MRPWATSSSHSEPSAGRIAARVRSCSSASAAGNGIAIASNNPRDAPIKRAARAGGELCGRPEPVRQEQLVPDPLRDPHRLTEREPGGRVVSERELDAGQVGERHAKAVDVSVLALQGDCARAVLDGRRGVARLRCDRCEVCVRHGKTHVVAGLLKERDAFRVELRGTVEVMLGDRHAAQLRDAARRLVEVVELAIQRERFLELGFRL